MTEPPGHTPAETEPVATTRHPSDRAEQFVASLPEVADRTRRETTCARVGMVVMAVGLVSAVIAVVLSQTSDNPLDQSTQISLGIAGLAAVGAGGVVFLRYSFGRLLRFWLLRLVHTRHEDATTAPHRAGAAAPPDESVPDR